MLLCLNDLLMTSGQYVEMHMRDALTGIRPILDSHMKILCPIMLTHDATNKLPRLVELEDLGGLHVSQLGHDALRGDHNVPGDEGPQVHKGKHLIVLIEDLFWLYQDGGTEVVEDGG